jgi:hypothetical protein
MKQGLARGSRVAEHHMGPNLRILPSASDVARGKGNELLSEGGFSSGDLVLHFRGWREYSVRRLDRFAYPRYLKLVD